MQSLVGGKEALRIGIGAHDRYHPDIGMVFTLHYAIGMLLEMIEPRTLSNLNDIAHSELS